MYQFNQMRHDHRLMDQVQWWYLIAVLVLAPLNWFVESVRWKILMDLSSTISIKNAWKSVMAGFSLAIITPSRIGDYAGRAILSPGRTLDSVVATFWLSLWQNLVNMIVGMVGVTYLYFHLHNRYLLPVFGLGLLSSVAILILLYHRRVRQRGYQYLQSIAKGIINFELKIIFPSQVLSKKTSYIILIFSTIRYFIYFSQYVLTALGFGIVAPAILLLSIISTLIMIQSLIPLPDFIGLLSRAQVGVMMWGLIAVGLDLAVAITTTIWIINILLPSIVGLPYVLSAKQLSTKTNSSHA